MEIKSLSFLLFLFLSSPIFSSERPVVLAASTILSLDLDGDGALCKMECTNQMLERFIEYDQDKDGFLDLNELTIYFTDLEKQQQEK